MKSKFHLQRSGHSSAVYCLETDYEMGRIYSGSADRMVGSWRTDNFEPDSFSINVGSPVYSILKSGHILYVGQSEGGIHVLDLQGKKEIRHLKFHNRPIFQIIENELHKQIYSLGGDGNLSIIARDDYALLWSIPISEDKLRAGILSPDSLYLLVGGSDGYIRVLETGYFNLLQEVSAHSGGVYDLKWISNNRLISCGRDGHLRFFDFKKGELIETDSIPAHNYAIYAMDFSPSGLLATASRDKTVKIWDQNDWKNPLRISRIKGIGHTHSVNVVKWIDESLLVSMGDDRNLFVWTISGS